MTEDDLTAVIKKCRWQNRLLSIALVAADVYLLWVIALAIVACIFIFTPLWVEGITFVFILTLWSAVPMILYWVIEWMVQLCTKGR